MTPPIIELKGLTRRFGDFVALDSVSLSVAPGEFLTLLGASGSGKTTTLRLIAGFDLPDAGEILMDGQDIAPLPPYRRPINTVFQQYALFPHMSVRENVAYGLRMRKVPKGEIKGRVDEALKMVQLGQLDARAPKQLSGGQQQRVALARALVNRPRVLLLDEPLGALDLKLRKEMQLELKHLQTQVGITFIYVTHDQEEALTMSDRIALMRQGRIEQVGTPREIYARPRSRYVADFIGEANLLKVPTGWLSVRPESISPVQAGEATGPNQRKGTVTEVVYAGVTTRVHLDIGGGERLVYYCEPGREPPAMGSQVTVGWAPEAGVLLGDDAN
jgi:ABC-type Fe3+/spermidine/putrescine transport system ATPase subunit